jgi:hypothetical protein
VFGTETARFLESGCALIVGTVGADGDPYATRGWGLDIVSDQDARIRILIDASDSVTLDRLSSGGGVAITGTDVPTLRSVQVKGRALLVEDATEADRARAGRFCDVFFTDVVETEGTPRELLDRLEPADYMACLVEVDELYDQTPGPGAGQAMTTGRS